MNNLEKRVLVDFNEMEKNQSDINEKSVFSDTEQLSILDQKNEYLSSNLIETNSHLLSLYEQMKSLEKRINEKIGKEQQFLYQVISRPAIQHVKKTHVYTTV